MQADQREAAPANAAVVLLNWRTAAMTLKAVERVFRQTATPRHVFVVENGSGDDSPSVLAAGLQPYRDRATLLVNERNLGFGGGCNTALRTILGQDFDWVWLLNSDAEPEQDCLAALLEAGRSREGAGMVGTALVDPATGEGAHFGSRMHPVTLSTGGVHTAADLRRRFSWLTAASLLVSTEALNTVGLFDERYFMYWEDADLNVRVRKAGFALVAAPGARALHSAGTSSRGMQTQRYLWHFASQRLFLEKHHPAPGLALRWMRFRYVLKAALDRDLERAKALLRV